MEICTIGINGVEDKDETQNITLRRIHPRFPDKPKIRQAGKSVIFEVMLEADPLPELRWTKAGVEIKTGGRYKTSCQTTGTQHLVSLEIAQVNAEDGGEYLVNAKNKLGDSTATINLNIGGSKAPANKAPKFLEKPVIRMDKAKGEVVMSCKMEAKPKATLTWYLNDVQVEEIPGKRFWVVQEQSDDIYLLEIHIASPKPEDGGTYRINAKNSAGESNANINLNLQGRLTVLLLPEVIDNSEVLYTRTVLNRALLGWPLFLHCNKVANYPASARISRHGFSLKNFMNADSGSYRLVAKNPHGDAASNVEVKMPRIVGMPNVRFENNNQQAVLEVKVDSGSLPTSVWSTGGKTITMGGRYSTNAQLETGGYRVCLIISDLVEKDSGNYECEISNGVGTVQQLISLKVPPKDSKATLPQIIGTPGPQRADVGRTFILTVDFSAGSVTPQAKVLKKGMDLASDKRATVRVDATKRSIVITLKSVTADDGGSYVLQLLTDGTVCDKTSFDLTVIQEDEATEEDDELGELQVPSNRSSRRSSAAKKEEDFLNRRASSEKSGGLLDPKALEQSLQARRDSMTNRRTSLADAIPGFAGLKHRETPKVEKEYFIEEVQDLKIKEGSIKALLKCTFCKPTSRFRWYKNKLEIFQGPKYNFLQEGNEYALEIKRIAMEDVGKYTCKCNDISTTCTLVVEERKQTYHFNQKLPKTAEVVRGKDLTVECSVSDPRAPVVWYHKGEKIEYVAGKVEIKRRENRCILRIVRARPEQEGEYCCMVEGDETYIDIAVEDPIDYVVERCEAGLGNWERVIGSVVDNSIAVRNLTKGKQYRFRVAAVNAMGTGEFGETATAIVAKNPYDPPGPPENLKIEEFDRRSVTLAWKPPKDDGGNPIKGYLVEKRTPKGEWRKATNNIVPNPTVKLTNVDEGQTYEFRVSAVNDAGPGKPSSATAPHTVKDPVYPPSAPENLNVDKVTKNGVKLSWNKPRRDGGAPITGYVVEKKADNGEWVPVLNTGDTCAFVPMKEGEAAEFRVRAINEEGPGEPTKPTPALTAADVPEPPRICTPEEGVGGPGSGVGGLKDITLKAGQNLRLAAAWFGYPQPTAVWTTGGKTVKVDGSRTKTSNEPPPPPAKPGPGGALEQSPGGTAVLEVHSVRRADGGDYELTLTNDLGQVKTSCHVEVLDVPGPPEGPLEPTDVNADEITLKWKPPLDDGGQPITNYILEKRPKGSDAWQKVSNFLSTPTATVRNLETGKEYEFRVMAENAMGVGEPLMTTKAIKAKHPYDPPSGMSKPVVEDTTDDSVTLAWEPPRKGPVTGYIVEKRPKGSKEWIKANPANVTGTNYTVKGLPKGKEFEFRVVPYNLAGLGEPSEPTDVTKVQFPTNYVVEKNDALTGVWERVPTTVTDCNCPVRGLVEGKRYRFRVSAVNMMGASEPCETSSAITAKNPFDAPDSPEDVKIDEFDKHGVKLSWKPPASDGGNPIQGYLVEKRTPAGEWKPATSGLVSGREVKLDDLETGQTYEFRVSAVNDAGPGRPSKATAPQVIKDPTFPPGSPDNLNVDKVNKNGVKLSWQKPRKDGGSKVTGYQVEKKDDDGNWVPVKQTTEPCAFIPMKEGETGQFRVRAINEEGPGEPTKPTAPITAADQPEAPRIVTPEDCVGGPGTGVGGLKDVKLKAGQELRLAAAWFGFPPPTLSWSLNGKPVKADGKKTVETSEPLPPPANPGPGGALEQSPGATAVLTIPKARRADAGEYKLALVNEHGQATTSCNVEVIDVPSAPTGPLEATEVKADEITLRWKAPEDDGGEPVTNYILEKKPKNSPTWEKVSGFLSSPTATVRNLDEGTEYEFRVMAENAMGISEPLMTDHSIKAKHPFDPPSGMSKPTVEDTTDDSVTLAWEPPIKGPVTGYIVEKRAKGERAWSKVPSTGPITGTNFTVKNLPKGKEMEFRVIPINAAGPGEPSEPTDLVKVQKPVVAPKIGIDAPREVNARLGEPCKIRIPYTGSPPDKVEMTKNGVPVPLDSDRFNVEITPDEVIITDKKVVKDDAGPHQICLKNEKGEATAPVMIKVQGPPEAPLGPLEVSNIKGDSCKLSWNPPSDNGGSPITNYVVEKMDKRTGEWVPVSRFVRAPEYDVTGLEEGNQYKFRVRAENDFGVSEPLETDRTVTAESPATTPDAPSNLNVADVDADKVTLEWTKPRKDGGKRITGYVVEYKPVNADDWEKGPTVREPTATVDGLKKGEKYVFRVCAKNDVGVGEPSGSTRPVECKPKYTTADSPGQPTVDDVGKNYVELSWPRPVKDGGARITGYVVEKRKKNSPDWEPATKDGKPVSGNQARIDDLDEGGEYEFRVKPVNAAGVGAPSEPTPMTKIRPKRDKPDAPDDVKVAELFADHCKLEWKAPEHDGGSPITGYVVEKCDAVTGVWERVPNTGTGTSCPVKGLTEGKRYRFRVAAVNTLGESEPTEAIGAYTAKNPFDVPDAPDHLNIDSFDKHSVDLSWNPPQHDGGNPVKGYLIEKRTPKGEWKPATAGLVNGSSAHLTGLEPGQTVEFRVSAVNDAGPSRPSRATAPHEMRDPVYPAAAPENLHVDKVNKNGVKLSWQKPRKDGGSKVTGYQVEKKDDDGNWVPVKQTTEPCAFIPMKEGETGQFRVRAINEEGPGEPTKPTPPITAADQPEAPRIVTPEDCVGGPGTGVGGLKDVTLKAGHDLELPVAWFGHPAPTFTWTLDGKPIRPDGSRITTSDGRLPPPAHPGPGGVLELSPGGVTILHVGKVTRADCGRYQLQLSNDLGQVTTSCQVTVIGPPAAPGGPLEPVEVKENEITLRWKPPEDDGGEPVTNYVLEKRPKRSDNWQKVSGFLKTPTATVRNLEEGEEYEFRVMAENALGTSEPLVTDHAIKPRHPFDPPSGMSTPEVVDTSDDSVTLAWDPPHKGPTTGYIVEKRAKGDRSWTKVNPHPTSGTEYTVKGLPQGKEFEFRVIPVNAAGSGEPSDPTPLTKVQKPTVAPKIGRDAPREVNAVDGEPFKIRIPYTGSPPDTVQITKDGIPIDPNSGRFQTVITPDEVIITDTKAQKDDSGNYKIGLKNAKGEDTLPLKINVMGPPSPPQGPLEVSNIRADSCTLSWRPPSDTGGSPITNYVVERQDTNTGEWVPVSKFVRAPEYDVMGLEEGKKQKFRVRAANDFGLSEPLELEKPFIAENPTSAPEPPGVPEVADVDADTVTLEWTKPKNDGGSRVNSYVVEVKPAVGGDWTKAQTGPVKGTSATVTGLKPGEKYMFRVSAKNDAGLGEPSRATRPVECRPKYVTADSPDNLNVDGVGKNHVDLSWTRPTKDGGARILGYQVEMRKKDSPDWTPVNPVSEPITSQYFHVDGLNEGDDVQFRVRAINAAGPGEPSTPTPMVKVEDRKATETPDFVSKIRQTTAPVGGVAVFEVQVDGKPMPTVRWFRDGVELMPGSRVRIQPPGPDGKAVLELSDLDDRDGGTITCQASNPSGKNSCSAPLEVLGAPRALSGVDDKVAAEGDLIKFKVPYSGRGNISLKLKRDGREVPESPRVKLMDLDGMASVQLKDLTRDMGGEYSLEIGNESGFTSVPFNIRVLAPPGECQGPLVASDTTPFSTRLSWKPPRSDGGSKVTHYVVEKKEVGRDRWVPVSSGCREPTCEIQGLQENGQYLFRVAPVNDCGQGDWIELPEPLIARYPFDKPGKPGELTCNEVGSDFVNLSWTRPSSDGGGRIRGYYIEKREVNSPNWSRITQQPVLTTSFNVPNLLEDCTYEFRVLAVNDAGESQPSVIDRPVLVKDPKAVSRPTLIGSLRAQTVSEGHDVEFEIEVDCPSNYEVVWSKGPRDLVPSHRIEMIKEGRKHVLRICDCGMEDTEEYSVKVFNRAGSKISRAPLAVKCKPRINLPSRWQEPTEWDKGDTIQVKVPYTGFPKPKATWKLNGKELREGKQVQMALKDRHAILTLDNVGEEFSGKLQLELENEMGSDSATIELRINDRPPPPINLKVEGVADGSALLSWSMPANSGYISQYIIERRELPGDSWIRAGTNRFSTYNCEGLVNGKEYEFRVIAENLHGRSDPCKPTEARLIQPDTRKRGDRKGEGRGDYTGPPIDNYDRFYRNIWEYSEPLPTQVHKGDSVYDYYDILEELGKGAFGVVHRCREKSTGNFYACKFVEVNSPQDRQIVHNEIEVMKDLHHPKLIRLHEAFEDKNEMAMVMEL
ncbi:unnamed protein product [Dicrocoelium dendriticum]|nr:unnamed protein product [Dicrocoelium dendriticum]